MNASATDHDIIIRGGTLIDGTGSPARPADIAISGDRIVAVGTPELPAGSAALQEIDANGLVVAPGFIDVHTHDDNAVLATPLMEPKISQGVTTVVTGNCGISLAPLVPTGSPPPPLNLLGDEDSYCFEHMADYLAAVRRARPNLNVAALVGHSTLRVGCMADLDQPASEAETRAMAERLDEGLAAGAIGLSSGLYYKTGMAADMAEMVALTRRLGDHGGIYTTHMRDEGDHIMASLEETVSTARAAGVPVVISHHKCTGPANRGRSVETLDYISLARNDTVVGLDAYPYAAGSTVLDPDWVEDGVPVMITTSEPHPERRGQYLADIAADWNCTEVEAARRLGPAGAIYFRMHEDDVQRILAYPPTMIGSDGLPHDGHPHPRLWGAFPRVLGHYSRDLGLFDLATAVHKMTGLSAATFGLPDRGLVRENAFADLVIFDAATVADVGTYENPKQPAAGIEHVLVNGIVACTGGQVHDSRSGQVISRPGRE